MPKTGHQKFKAPLVDINNEIRKFENKQHHRKRALPRFTQEDLIKVYTQYNGACVFCGLPVSVEYRYRYKGAYFMFEVPLEKGGKVETSNLILSCSVHKDQYLPHKRLRERIPDVDSFADLTEALLRAVVNNEGWEITRRIKREMNTILEEIAVHSRYMIYKEDRPIRIRTPKRDNSIADSIEKLAKGEDTKQDITDGLKTIHVTKQYRTQH